MQQDNLVDSSTLKEVLTVITISKSLVRRDDLHGLPFISHVADYQTQRSWYKAYKDAVAKVKTKYFLLIDVNDNLPEQLIVPQYDVGMVYGDYCVKEFGRDFTRPMAAWKPLSPNLSPILINRPILDTEKTKKVLSVFNGSEIINQAIVYHLVGKLFGARYSNELKIVWNKDKADDFHKYSKSLIDKTTGFILNGISPILKTYSDQKELERLESLIPISELSDKLTVVTLSKEPFTRDDIGNLPYVNYNSTFDKLSGFFLAIKAATRMVKTPFMVFVDTDDKIEDRLLLPDDNVGLVYGDFYLSEDSVVKRIETGEFSEQVFLSKPWMMHKPILNTEKFRSVVEKFPLEEIDVQSILYYFVAKIYGAQYNENLKLVWTKKNRNRNTDKNAVLDTRNRNRNAIGLRNNNKGTNTALHTKAYKVRHKAITFIEENQDALIRSITGQVANSM